MHMPSVLQGEKHKLRCPFYGLYCVWNVMETNAEGQVIDSPNEDPIFVNLNQIRLCHLKQKVPPGLAAVKEKETSFY